MYSCGGRVPLYTVGMYTHHVIARSTVETNLLQYEGVWNTKLTSFRALVTATVVGFKKLGGTL
jgi:hypothetical protein